MCNAAEDATACVRADTSIRLRIFWSAGAANDAAFAGGKQGAASERALRSAVRASECRGDVRASVRLEASSAPAPPRRPAPKADLRLFKCPAHRARNSRAFGTKSA
jgi:hypothetical protein